MKKGKISKNFQAPYLKKQYLIIRNKSLKTICKATPSVVVMDKFKHTHVNVYSDGKAKKKKKNVHWCNLLKNKTKTTTERRLTRMLTMEKQSQSPCIQIVRVNQRCLRSVLT